MVLKKGTGYAGTEQKGGTPLKRRGGPESRELTGKKEQNSGGGGTLKPRVRQEPPKRRLGRPGARCGERMEEVLEKTGPEKLGKTSKGGGRS